VYTFSQGKLKVVANKQYTTIKNNYELTFDTSSVIIPAQDSDDIKRESFNFVKISDLTGIEVNHLVDVVGESYPNPNCNPNPNRDPNPTPTPNPNPPLKIRCRPVHRAR
jgi:hypothetical protein